MKLWHVYAAIGAISLVLVWVEFYGYAELGLVEGTERFLRDAFSDVGATRTLAVDVLGLAAVAFTFIWIEGKKLGIGAGWRIAYMVLGWNLGIAAFVAFFFAHRQRILDAQAS